MLFSHPDMLFFQGEEGELVPGAPGWMPEAIFAVLVILVCLALVGVVLLWTQLGRLRAVEARAGAFARVEDLHGLLGKLANDREDLDLRRIEHLLVDLREAQERLEDALLRAVETKDKEAVGTEALVPKSPDSLGERVINRLLALGYERVQIVTRSEKLIELASKGGEVLVEARRQGVLHKGRVVIRGGRIADVEIHPAYSIFP